MAKATEKVERGFGPETVLQFSPVQDVVTFLKDTTHAGKRGVYVWGFRFPDSVTGQRTPFTPCYAGMAYRTDIKYRIRGHVDGIENRTHRILKRDILLGPDCRKYFHHDVAESEHCAYAYRAVRDAAGKQCHKKKLCEADLKALGPHIKAYTDNLFVTCLATNGLGLSDEAKFVGLLERYVQDLIGRDRLISRVPHCPASFSPTIKPGLGTEHLFPRP